ncbi:hypothetical protein [Neobacillus sp. YIM B06451]|uniref:hypothetical protein n=1 Tax=Neobacillus sp. YIM B06451 TaxID=3070994 RepID=UPI00292D86A5|nr:hypothetical protein [Neobacillus sp. YIM B06451]
MVIKKSTILIGTIFFVLFLVIGILIFYKFWLKEDTYYPEYEDGITVKVINQSHVELPDLQFSLGTIGDPNYKKIGSVKGLNANELGEIHVPKTFNGPNDLSFYIQYRDTNNKLALDAPLYIPGAHPKKIVVVLTIKEVTDSGILIYEYEAFDGWDKIGPYPNDINYIDYED